MSIASIRVTSLPVQGEAYVGREDNLFVSLNVGLGPHRPSYVVGSQQNRNPKLFYSNIGVVDNLMLRPHRRRRLRPSINPHGRGVIYCCWGGSGRLLATTKRV